MTGHKWHCTCQIRYKNNHNYLDAKHLKLHETIADEEGICKHCGHYAVAISDFELFPRNTVNKSTDIFGYRPVATCDHKWRKEGLTRTMMRKYFNEETDSPDARENFIDNVLEKKLEERKQ
tara:strand:- start:210 stop:572 length:363 start_codon:yes stop_codon:yes gene_type:complete